MTNTKPIWLAAAVGCALVVTTPLAWAQQPDPDPASAPATQLEGTGPWHIDVTDAQKAKANEVFHEAGKLLDRSLFDKAAEAYATALTHWDHPAIHYNRVLALISLDRPIEVYRHLEKALQYPPEKHPNPPLKPEKFARAERYKLLVEKQLAWIEVVCDVEGAKVSLNGKPLFVGPGRQVVMVKIGDYNVVASKEGFIDTNEPRSVKSGERALVNVKLFTVGELTEFRNKWAVWKPWAVVGGGAAVVILGGVLHATASSRFGEFDDGIRACGGCQPDGALSDKKASAETLQTVAILSYVIGGAALATGGVLVYLNRARPYRTDEPQLPQQGVSVTPVISPNFAGFSASLSF